MSKEIQVSIVDQGAGRHSQVYILKQVSMGICTKMLKGAPKREVWSGHSVWSTGTRTRAISEVLLEAQEFNRFSLRNDRKAV